MKNTALTWLWLLGFAGRAFAQDAAPEEGDVVTAPVQVKGKAAGDARAPQAERTMDTPSFVTPIIVDESAATAESISDVLAESVGVNVRALGGLGAFSAVSVRGAAPGQTAIFVDGVPVSRMATSLFDLSSLDRAGFSRIDVYRGGVPVQLGGAALGGAINFVTALGTREDGTRNRLVTGFGSYGGRRFLAERRDNFASGRGASAASVSYSGSTGDFSYFDDNGTPLNLDDDSTSRRFNNRHAHLQASGRVRFESASGTSFDIGNRLSLRNQGVAGPVGVEAENANLHTLRNLLDATWRDPGALSIAELDLVVRGHVFVERQRWRDIDNEVGLEAQDTTFTTLGGGLTASANYAQGEHQLFLAAIETCIERFSERDRLASEATDLDGTRLSFAASVADEVMLADDDVVIVPAVRIDTLITRAQKVMPRFGDEQPPDRNDLFVSPRLGARWRFASAMVVKANAGRYARPPTLTEVFGDRGFVIGNPNLLAETGWSTDIGLIFAPKKQLAMFDRLYVETATFFARAHNWIAFVPTAGRVARATNLRDVTLWGQELTVSTRAWRSVTLSGNYTFLNSRQDSELISFDGKRLPGRPRHELYVRLDIERTLGNRRKLSGYADLTFASGAFIDAANLNQAPTRRFVGIGLRATPTPHFAINVEVKNLFDETVDTLDLAREVLPGVDTIPRAVSDVLGYPLPGRTFFAGFETTF